MKTLCIIGSGGHSKVVFDAVNRKVFQKVTFLVHDEYLPDVQKSKNEGIVASLEEAITQEARQYICAIGSIVNRKAIYDLARSHAWSPQTIKHATTTISESAIVGEGSFIGPQVVINAYAAIGQNCIINSGAIIEHNCTISDHVNISPAATVCGNVKVSQGTLIGAGATILPGVEIGENCIVGAGSVVTCNINNSTTVKGVPACTD